MSFGFHVLLESVFLSVVGIHRLSFYSIGSLMNDLGRLSFWTRLMGVCYAPPSLSSRHFFENELLREIKKGRRTISLCSNESIEQVFLLSV